jgi:hypothetical protein
MFRPITPLMLFAIIGLVAAASLPARDRPTVTTPHAALLGGISLAPDVVPHLPDPFPIRRLLLAEQRFDPPTLGGFRKLPHDEFEARVQEAATAQLELVNPPALVKANYEAKYADGQLSGRLTWTFVNPNGTSGIATLDTLRIGIQNLQWDAGRAGRAGRAGLLFRGKLARQNAAGLHLQTEPAGGDLSADWSLRGTAEPDQERFEFAVPTAAIASLELVLPADRTVVSTSTAVVFTGPVATDKPNESRWKVQFGGQSSIQFVVRLVGAEGGTSQTVTRAAKYELMPGQVLASFELTGLTGSAERSFVVEPGLRVTGVAGLGSDRWRFEPGDNSMSVGRLVLQGVGAGRVVVMAVLVPPLDGQPVRFPSLRPTMQEVGADTCDVFIHPDLTLVGWENGDYRVLVSGQQPDRTFRLQFQGSIVATPGARRSASVRVQLATTAYTSDENLEWVVEPGRTRLTAKIKIKVTRGPLALVTAGCTPGYTLDAVNSGTDGTAVAFRLQGEPAGVWLIEPTLAIPTGQTAEFRLEFSSPSGLRAADPLDPAPSPRLMPYPDFVIAATDRTGVLAVTGRGVRATARPSTGLVPLVPAGFTVPYRGRLPSGEAILTPERTHAVLKKIEVAVTASRISTTLIGTAEDAPFGSLTLFAPADAEVKAPGALVQKPPPLEQFPLLANPGWGTLAALATGQTASGAGGIWQLLYPRPVQGEFTVTVVSSIPEFSADTPLTLPLPTLGGVNTSRTTVTLSANLLAAYRLPNANQLASGLRAFPARLELAPNQAQEPTTRTWQFADITLNNTAAKDSIAVVLRGRVNEAAAPLLPIHLPDGAILESVTVGQKWATVNQTLGGIVFPLPELPSGGLPFEVRYQLPKPAGVILPEFCSPIPEFPAVVSALHRWTYADGVLPWPNLDASQPDSRFAVRVLPLSFVWAIGLLLGGIVLVIGIGFIARQSRFTSLFFVGLLVGSGCIGWATTGGWWVLVRPAFIVALGVWAGFVVVRKRPLGAVGLLGFVGISALLFGQLTAQTEEPATVFLVNAENGKFSVYVPPAVLSTLAEWSANPLPSVVLTQCEYRGEVADGVAIFDATLKVTITRDGPQNFTIPLAGIRLERATVDGTDTFLDAAKPDRYTVSLRGQSTHTIGLRFAVIPSITGSIHEVRFTGPEVPACSVKFRIGAKSSQPDVISRRGRQTIQTDTNSTTVAADHGGDRTVSIRWRDSKADSGSVASVREAAIWDLNELEPAVTTAFTIRLRDGPTDRIRFDLPTGLRTKRVTLRSADPINTVKSWSAGIDANGWKPITVNLTQPTDGPFLLLVRAVPVEPLSAKPVLRFPRLAEVPNTDRDSVYGVRLNGVSSSGMTLAPSISHRMPW